MATLIQTLQNLLAGKDPLLAPETKRIILKEVLQAYVLDYLNNHTSYRRLSFYGGTCLHVVYGLNRLSEDLDFDNQAGLDLEHLAENLAQYFQKAFGYGDASAKTQRGQGGILRVTVKSPVLNVLGLSPHLSVALHLKVEVSKHEQVAVIPHTPVFVYGRSLVAAHFSLETMLAGKMLACLQRNFERGRSGAQIKGRDFYDLLWFMQQRVQPLEAKLVRDGQQPYTVESAMLALQEKHYIGDEILQEENAQALWNLIQSRESGGQGIYFYVCGRTGFATAVMDAIKAVIYRFSSGSEEERKKAVQAILYDLVGKGRYLQDIFSTYTGSLDPARDIIVQRTPHRDGEADEAWDRRVRSQYVDSCRFLLPAASLANVGMTANARVLENMIRKMLSHELAEVREIGKKVKEVAKGETPTLVKYADAVPYLIETIGEFSLTPPPHPLDEGQVIEDDWCTLVSYDQDGEDKVLAAALFRFGEMSYAERAGLCQSPDRG